MSKLGSISFKALIRGVYAARCSTPKTIKKRQYCQNVNVPKPQVTETLSGQHLFRNQRKPTNFDKKVLVWGGRYKKSEDIPAYVSCEVLSAARNNVRIKTCMAMILGTIIGCIVMVISGKKALKEDNTLLQRNLERKAKLREQAAQEQMSSIKNH
ncbi:protein FAM162A-like [Pelobates fuscus]|uniref:protein FAM162A-like n=1 Tax=Pelobates fuscus TaxID=191477 RepID=UPI002FE45792